MISTNFSDKDFETLIDRAENLFIGFVNRTTCILFEMMI